MSSQVIDMMHGSETLYEGYVDKVIDGAVVGWVRKTNSEESLLVKIYSNDQLISSGVTNQYRDDLKHAGKGSGWSGFSVSIPQNASLDGLRVEADGSWNIPFSFALNSALGNNTLPAVPQGHGKTAAKAQVPDQSAIWVDISDFLFYLRHHKTVSGIQRVQCEVIRAILNNGWSRYRFCITTPECTHYYQLPEGVLNTLLMRLDINASVPEAEWISYVSMIGDVARLQKAKIVSGNMLFVLGAFWVFPEIPHLLTALRSEGVHIGLYVYDLIPLYYPEYCDIDLIKNFVLTFSLVAQLADLILTISDHTAKEVDLYYRLTGQSAKTIRPVLLAHELRHSAREDDGPSAENALRVVESVDGPYVLCVCTIEIRKNHIYLFRVWRELLKKYGKDRVPKLVLVGRRGWRVDDFFAQLEATRYLDGHVVTMSGLDDAELEALYKNCMFTVFPSYNEGWGLPVGESLVYGKLCVASRATSIPEVGNDFSIYIDPDNVSDGLQTIEKIIFTPNLREQVEERIRTQFVPRSWNSVGKTFVDEVETYLDGVGGSAALLPPGRLRCGDIVMVTRSSDLCSTDDIVQNNPGGCLLCTQGWYPPEHWGTWGRGKQHRISFVIDPNGRPVPARLRVYLKLTLPPWIRNSALLISSSCGASNKFRLTDKRNYLFTLDCTPLSAPGNQSYVDLRLLLERDIDPAPPEVRRLGIGIHAIMAVDADDLMQRFDAFERIIAATAYE